MFSTITAAVYFIGVVKRHLGLAIKRLLADLQRQRRFGSNDFGVFHDNLIQVLARHDAVDQPEFAGRRRIGWSRGEQHLHGLLAVNIAGERHHRRRAEQADIDARRAEGWRYPCTSPGRQEATSWQPAAVASPSTSAITGTGRCTTVCISSAQSFMVRAKNALPRSSSARWRVSSFKSWPAENNLPGVADAMITGADRRVFTGGVQRILERLHHGDRQGGWRADCSSPGARRGPAFPS